MKTLKTIVESNIQGQFTGRKVHVPVLKGAPGSGKSSFLKQICKDNNYSLVNVSFASLDLVELSGLPNDVEVPEMAQYSSNGNASITQWSMPEVIYQANRIASQGQNVVILLDDIHEANRSTQTALYELLLERKLKNFTLDPKVAIVATMNDSDESGFEGMSSPIVNRLAFLQFNITHEEWHNVSGRFYHHFIASFLKGNSNFLHEPESVHSPYGTPRSWEALSEHLKLLPEEFAVNNIQTIAKQYVTNNAVAELTKHIHYLMKIDFGSLVKNRASIDIPNLSPLDQILYIYIVDYIKTADDGLYFAELLNNNLNAATYIGYTMGRLYTKYQAREKGEKLSVGVDIVLSKLLDRDEPLDNKFTAQEQKVFNKLAIKNGSDLLASAAKYIL